MVHTRWMTLHEYLTASNLTVLQLAERLATHRVSVARYVRGARMPTLEMIDKIHEVTGGQVTATDLHQTRMADLRSSTEKAMEKSRAARLPGRAGASY